MENNKEGKGITLIALVITIIILLILAGVSIAMLTGENGMIDNAKKAMEETKKAQVKDKIELALIEIQTEEIPKEGKITLETIATENLLNKKLEGITAEFIENEIIGIYEGYTYNITEKWQVVIGDKINIKKIEMVAELEGTKGEEDWYNTDVTISIKEKNNNKIQKIIYQINDEPEIEIKGEVANIQISEQGENKLTYYAIGPYNQTSIKQEELIKIDKTAPENVQIIQKEQEDLSIKLDLSANDNLSGIKKYEIYLNGNKNTETTENSYTITGLEGNTEYKITAKAIDKAGNQSEISNQITLKTQDYYVNGHITFLNMYGYVNTAAYIQNVKEAGKYLFDEDIGTSGYGSLLLVNYENTYLDFSVDANVKIQAYGTMYKDSAGNSRDKRAKISKYNTETKTYEPYKTVYAYTDKWYDFVDLESGKYRLQALDVYVSFNEWKILEQ